MVSGPLRGGKEATHPGGSDYEAPLPQTQKRPRFRWPPAYTIPRLCAVLCVVFASIIAVAQPQAVGDLFDNSNPHASRT